MPPGLDTSAPGYAPPTGQAQRLTFDLRDLGVGPPATLQLFADASATDGALRLTTQRGYRFTVDTAAFGGFIAVL